MSESTGEKRHAPSARRLAMAREKGDIKRSADLPKAAATLLVTGLAFGAATSLAQPLQAICAAALANAGTASPALAASTAMSGAAIITPLLGLIFLATLAAAFLSGGWVFALNLLNFDLSKLLPHHGLGQLVSSSGISETAKSCLKFLLIGGTGALAFALRAPAFAALAASPLPDASALATLILGAVTLICGAVTLLAAGDYGLQIWLHRQSLRMTDQDLRDESKDAAGNPQIRQRQRMLARRLARARQMHRIAEASVIVTNPTHFAVAIRYRRGADHAPLLLAKGAGLLAAEIISRGRGLGIPVVESPPLARAVYRHVEPGEPVPAALYRACAEVLAYIWRLQRWRAQGGPRPTPPKPAPGEIEVPRF